MNNKRNILLLGLAGLLLASCGGTSESISSNSGAPSISESMSSEDIISSIDSVVSSSEVENGQTITGKGIDIQVNGPFIKSLSRSVYVTFQNESYRGEEVVFEVDNDLVASIADLDELMGPSGYDYSYMPEALVKGVASGTFGIHVYLKNHPEVEVLRYFEVKEKEEGRAMPQGVFASLTSSMKVETTQNQFEFDKNYDGKEEGAYETTTIFEETGAASTDVSTGPRTDAYCFIENNLKTNTTKTYSYYRTNGNKAGTEVINEKNLVTVNKIVDEDGYDYSWGATPYWNFFAAEEYATAEDFVSFDNGNTYIFTGDFMQASYLCYSLFLSPFSPDDFFILVQKDGSMNFYVNVDPTFDPTTKASDKKYGQVLTGSFTELGTAEVPHLTPYAHESYHDNVNEAISKMANLQQYKAHVTANFSSGNGDSELTFTYTEDTIDQVITQDGDTVHSGIHRVDSEHYFQYSVNSSGQVVRQKDVAAYWHDPEKGVKRYPTFSFVGEIFESLGNNVYQTRGDLGYITAYTSYLPVAFSYCDWDQPVKITLNEDNYITKLETTTTYFDETIDLTIEYSEFGTATHGLDFDSTITEIIVTGWDDDPEAKGMLYTDLCNWIIDGTPLAELLPFYDCPVGWSGVIGWLQSDRGYEFLETGKFELAGGSVDYDTMNAFLAAYKAACIAAGYAETTETEKQTGGTIYRNDKGYEVSFAQKVNSWNGYATSTVVIGFRAPADVTEYVG
ncbi:MAG: hypothetical protein SPG64_02765 [Candidatus Enteromonas sp.]|nr:hypothetical protein [Candidatus Enteromonas sp.]